MLINFGGGSGLVILVILVMFILAREVLTSFLEMRMRGNLSTTNKRSKGE